MSDRRLISENFSRSEFCCKCGCGFDTVDAELLECLEDLRDYFGKPVAVNSGCRCKSHNESVKGKARSFHLLGRAADVTVSGVSPKEVFSYLDKISPGMFGVICYDSFVHVDTRSGSHYRGYPKKKK